MRDHIQKSIMSGKLSWNNHVYINETTFNKEIGESLSQLFFNNTFPFIKKKKDLEMKDITLLENVFLDIWKDIADMNIVTERHKGGNLFDIKNLKEKINALVSNKIKENWTGSIMGLSIILLGYWIHKDKNAMFPGILSSFSKAKDAWALKSRVEEYLNIFYVAIGAKFSEALVGKNIFKRRLVQEGKHKKYTLILTDILSFNISLSSTYFLPPLKEGNLKYAEQLIFEKDQLGVVLRFGVKNALKKIHSNYAAETTFNEDSPLKNNDSTGAFLKLSIDANFLQLFLKNLNKLNNIVKEKKKYLR